MNGGGLLLGLTLLLAIGLGPARAIDLRQRSESGTKQFVVYSEDVRLRQRVASFAEEVKADVIALLGESNLWKAPIVITLARATTLDQREPAATLRVAETQPGFKIEIHVKIGDDPASVNLRKLLLRAVLLEYAYRETGITGGEAFVEAPWWVIEGLIEMSNRREHGPDGSLYRRLVETNRLPPIGHFLSAKPDELGPTALAVDRALAMCLVELLIQQPGGRDRLARLIRDWPQSNADPAALVARNFPALGSGATLQKWWTLSVARFAAEDRYQGLTAEETEKALAPLLEFEFVINKAGEKKIFAVTEFDQYLKLPASRALLHSRHGEILALSTRANTLFRPVIADYEEIFSLLSRGKSRGMRDRLAKADESRRAVLRQTTEIADYLNWFEATQMGTLSGAFDNYLKTANEISEQDQKRKSPIGRYLDELEQEF
jgi:hypothetical protein